MTCELCLQNDPIVFIGSAAIHGYGPSPKGYGQDRSKWRVCADSKIFPEDIAVAPKATAAEQAMQESMKNADLTIEQTFILKRMVKAAPKIANNKHLRQILWKIDAAEREAFYDLLKPHLSFKPKPYMLLKF